MPWYTVQVSYYGEKESAETLRKTLQRLLGKAATEIFIPCLRAQGPHYTKDFYLLEGYAFVCFEGDSSKLFKIEGDPLFQTVVATQTRKGRFPEVVDDRTIEDMKQRMVGMLNPNDIVVGDQVVALDGVCRHMEGLVEGVSNNSAVVYFKLYSRERRESIPLFCLKRVGEVGSICDDEEEFEELEAGNAH